MLLSLLKELVSGFFSWIWEWPPNHHKLGSIWLPTLPCQLGPPPCIGFWKRCLLLNSHLATQSQTPSHLRPQSSASSPRQEPTNLPLPTSSFLLGMGLSHFLPNFPSFPKPPQPVSLRARLLEGPPPTWGRPPRPPPRATPA